MADTLPTELVLTIARHLSRDHPSEARDAMLTVSREFLKVSAPIALCTWSMGQHNYAQLTKLVKSGHKLICPQFSQALWLHGNFTDADVDLYGTRALDAFRHVSAFGGLSSMLAIMFFHTHPFNPTRVFLKDAPSLAVASIASRLQGLTHLRVIGSIIDVEPIVLALPALGHLFYQPQRAFPVGQVSVFSNGLCNMLREAVKLRRIVLILPTVEQQIPETRYNKRQRDAARILRNVRDCMITDQRVELVEVASQLHDRNSTANDFEHFYSTVE